MEKRPLVVIDIGTTKLFTLISKVDPEKKEFEILGYGFAKSKGLSKGVVVDVEEATASIEKSVRAAEKMANINVESAVIGISGGHIESFTTHSTVTISKYPREINEADKKKLEEIAEGKALKVEKNTIHKIAYNYRIDDGNMVKNPIGMIGSKLDADVHVITGVVNTIESLVKSVKSLNISVDGVVLEALASAKSVLSDAERKMGAILIDMGGGTTDIAVFKNNSLIYTDVIPLGGEHFTNDIAALLNLDLKTAEYLKLNIGSFLEKGNEFLEIPAHRSSTPKRINVSLVKSIIDSRTDEILELMFNSLQNAGVLNYINSGLVFTGGTAKTIDLIERADAYFGIPTRMGVPLMEDRMPDGLNVPENATGIGLIMYGVENFDEIQPSNSMESAINYEDTKEKKKRSGFVKGFSVKIKNLFDSFLD